MDLVATMSRGADNELSDCGDAEAWARITAQTQVDVGGLPGWPADEARAERLGAAVTVVVCGEGFRMSGAVDRAFGTAQWLLQHYAVADVTPWLLAAGIALEDTSGAGLALRRSRSRVWLAQLLMRELALSELDGLAELLQGRPNPPEKRWSEGDEETTPDRSSDRFFAEASKPVVAGLREFWSLTPRLCSRRERVVQATMIAFAAGLALAVASPTAAAALTLASAAMISHMRGRVVVSVVLAALAWWLGAPWWAAAGAIPIGLLLRSCAAVARRPLVGRLSGWRTVLPGGGRRRAERFLAHAYPVSALAEYEQLILRAGGTRRTRLLAGAAYAACDAEQYQRALDLATLGLESGPTRRHRARLHVAAAAAYVALDQPDRAADAAKAAYATLKDTDHRLNHTLIAAGEARGAAEHVAAARTIAIASATRALRRLQWVAAGEYVLHLGQLFMRQGRPADAWVCFHHARRLVERRYFAHLGEYDQPPAYGAWRPVLNLMAQTEIGMGEAQLRAGLPFRPDHGGDLPDPADGLGDLQLLERPLDLARAHQVCAEGGRQDGRPDRAVHHLFAALGIIDRNRYLIREPATRLRWIKANLQTHRQALALTHEFHDHAGVCELLEIGRLQGIPAFVEDAPARFDAAEIPLRSPPRVTIRGQSHLVDADGVDADADVVELTILTRHLAGDRGMLLSYWTNEDGCYWALLGPDILRSGRLDLAEPGLAATLAALHLGLPAPLPGEDADTSGARVRTGPFFADRAQEERLALGLSAVLPAPLRQHLATLGKDETVALVICPPPELARVPWPLIAVPEADSVGGAAPRLLDLADLHLGLTSALTQEVHRQITDDYTTDVAVVVDPDGNTAEPATGDTSRSGRALFRAQRMARQLPPAVRVHGGRWLGDGRPTTRERFEKILHASPGGGSLVFVGHCSSPEPGQSAAAAALVLASTDDAGPADLLRAHTLLHPPGGAAPARFPARVVLAACNTAGADASDAGDWLSLVPAVHWAGAREVVSSTVSVPDLLYRLERALIDWLSEDPDATLSHMLLTLQRDALQRWRDGESRVPPISWAFYMHSGVPMTRAADKREVAPPTQMLWSSGAMQKVRIAAQSACTLRRRVLHTSALSTAHIGYEVDDAESLAAAFIVYPMFALELLGGLGHNPIPLLARRTPRPSKDWSVLIAAAEAHARAHHRSMVCEIDVLSAMLERRDLSGSWLIRRLSNARHAAVRDREIRAAHTAPGWLHAATYDRPRTAAPQRPEGALLARLGFDEQWLRRNAIGCRRATFDRGFGGYWPIQQRVRRDQAINQSRFPPRNV